MKKEKRTLSYRMVKEYFRFIINGLYYRKFYSIDSQNIPADGTPVLIVSDHQFCLNDALGVAEVRFLRHGAAIRPLRDQVYQRIKKSIQ